MDNIDEWVKKSIDEEHEVEALTQKEVEWMQNARAVDGPGLPPQGHEFVRQTTREFPEFIWEWDGEAVGRSVVVHLWVGEDRGLPKEDYLSACMRIAVELDVNTRDIPKRRLEEFVALAESYGILVTFREMAELPREVVRRVNERLSGGKLTN